ncbi:hypothetical protein [Mucilaginibacter sp. L196]|uniref:hypothetical protein n=1 Tax=Mucilaginibacter sp. L196 TaxID=1641870 RepID=UPI00131B62C3|nr:hypothetical protein [Mucilaginibacter sp. L196]
MHNFLYKNLLVLLFLGISFNSYCQKVADSTATDTVKAKSTKKSSFKIGADYLNNNVFMGRTGLTTTPLVSPDIKYTFKPGIYISGGMDILPDNKKNKVDGGNLTAGYDFDITDDFSGGISYSKMFYNPNSTLIGSSITNTFSADFDYEIGDIITPSVSANYSLNNGANADIFINGGISHDFIVIKPFANNDDLIISPTVAINLGTQNFYDAYIKKKVFKSKKVGAAVAAFESNLSKFETLDYEFSVPLEYKIGHLIFEFIPTYAVVQNGFKSAAVAKAVGLSNNNDIVYFETGLSLKF